MSETRHFANSNTTRLFINPHKIYFMKTLSFCLILLISGSIFHASAQEEAAKPSDSEFQGFSATLYPAKRNSRGTGSSMDDLVPFATGSINHFDFQRKYSKVFLGTDFYDEASKLKACDSLKAKLGSIKSHWVPVSDGLFFNQSKFTKIEDLDGFYKFRNSKSLPGILPNVDVWIRMESYRHGKSSEKNCLIIKFLIPEDIQGKMVTNAYVLRNDGILTPIAPGTDPDFSLKMDFNQYCIFPLNDPTETTHLVGKDFNILGSFAKQRQCDSLKGLLFPVSHKGSGSGCVFFRKMSAETAPKF